MAVRTGIESSTSGDLQDGAVTESKLAARSVVADHLNQKRGPFVDATVVYSFGANGGATGAHVMTLADGGAFTLPAGAVILQSWNETTEVFTSGGLATVEIGLTDATDAIVDTAAFDNTPFNAVGVTAGLAIPLPLSAAQAVVLKVNTAALTAGAVRVHLTYRGV